MLLPPRLHGAARLLGVTAVSATLCLGTMLTAQTTVRRGASTAHMSSADERALNLALDAYNEGKAHEAEPMLRVLATKYPDSYEAHEALGSLYAEGGRLTEALPLLEKSCVLAPKDALAHGNLGATYLKLGRGSKAVRELEKAVTLDRHNLSNQANLAQALMSTGQPSLAAKAFSAAAQLSPGNSELTYNWALALYESGSPKEAASLLDALPEEARTEQVEALAADAQERAGDFARALAHFQTAARLNPSDGNVYALSIELLRHWTWAEAIEVAKYGTRLYPSSLHFRMAEGIGYYGKSDYKQAVSVFSSLLQADPDNATAADLLGRSCSLLADGESAGCGEMYGFAQRHPGNPVTDTYAAVSMLHAPTEKQDLESAATLLHSAITANPNYAEAYFQLGVLEQTRLHWLESAAALEKAIALRPESPEAHYRLSRAYTHLGRRDEAQAQIALHQTYSAQAKGRLDAKLQEVVRFLLKPS